MTSSQTHAYGVEYTPSTTVTSPRFTPEILEDRNIRFIRIQIVDLINNIRVRVVPLSYFKKLLASSKPGITITKAALGLVFITLAPGFSAAGEYLYVLDCNSIRICPYAPGHASVMGYFEEKVPLGVDGLLTVEVDICPRTILRRVVENAKRTTGVEFLVGFESEFILLKSTNPIEPVNTHGWGNAAALYSGTVEAKVLEEIAAALENSGVELQMYHAEAAPGQYEVITGPLAPLQAADALVHTRETIYNIASKHGLRATFAPRVYTDNCKVRLMMYTNPFDALYAGGSAAHTHISIHGPKKLSSEGANMDTDESSFLASVLEHLPALSAINLPLEASYKRMIDGVWSGGTHVCWGTDNREAPIRLCNAEVPANRNFEIKSIDGTSNPYLVLAGILGVGTLGIKDRMKLEMGDICGDVSAAMMSPGERSGYGVKDCMPLTLEDARRRFVDDKVVKDVFGGNFVEVYVAVNKVRRVQTER